MDLAVAEVDLVDLDCRDRVGVGGLATLFFLLLLKFGDNEAEVATQTARTADDEEAANRHEQHREDDDRRSFADRVLQEGGEHAATDAADGEHEEGDDRRAHAPQAVRHHALDRRLDHRERGAEECRVEGADGGEQPHVGHEVLDGHQQGGGEQQQAEDAECAVGVLAEGLVELPADPGQEEDQQHAGRCDGEAAFECVETEFFFEEEALNRLCGEEREADRRHCEGHVADRVDSPDAGEGGLDGARGIFLAFEAGPENVELLPVAAFGFGDEEGEDAENGDGDAEDEVGPAPAGDAAGDGGDAADEDR